MCHQAWAFACYVRKLLGFFPVMCIKDYPADCWSLHRKLCRRFLRYKNKFANAGTQLPAYVARTNTADDEGSPPVTQYHNHNNTTVTISLLSDSDVTESDTEGEHDKNGKETVSA